MGVWAQQDELLKTWVIQCLPATMSLLVCHIHLDASQAPLTAPAFRPSKKRSRVGKETFHLFCLFKSTHSGTETVPWKTIWVWLTFLLSTFLGKDYLPDLLMILSADKAAGKLGLHSTHHRKTTSGLEPQWVKPTARRHPPFQGVGSLRLYMPTPTQEVPWQMKQPAVVTDIRLNS